MIREKALIDFVIIATRTIFLSLLSTRRDSIAFLIASDSLSPVFPLRVLKRRN